MSDAEPQTIAEEVKETLSDAKETVENSAASFSPKRLAMILAPILLAAAAFYGLSLAMAPPKGDPEFERERTGEGQGGDKSSFGPPPPPAA
jgi:hypothetical protein